MLKNMQPILIACEKCIDHLGVKYFADKWGHSRQYIEKIVNPRPDPEEKKHFPLEYFVDVMVETNMHGPLSEVADALGLRVVPKKADPDGDDMRHEVLQAVVAVGEFIKAAENGASLSELIRLLEQGVKELEGIVVRARMQAGGITK